MCGVPTDRSSSVGWSFLTFGDLGYQYRTRESHTSSDFASQMVQSVAYNPPREGSPPLWWHPRTFSMALPLSKTRASEPPAIPDRLYFKIGDVAQICGVETYVLRFWETQFPQLKPNKSGTGQRLYRRRDVELALRIKNLVHIEGYTLAGARQALQQPQAPRSAPQPVQQNPDPQQDSPSSSPLLALDAGLTPSGQTRENISSAIAHARAELREIAALLASPDPQPARRRSRLATMPSNSDLLFPI